MRDTEEIEVRPSEIQPGRWNFYVRGTRVGSAHSKKRAILMAKEHLDKIQRHRLTHVVKI